MRSTMQGLSGGTFIHQLERLFQYRTTGGLTEGELLDRFVRANDESAFEDILARHGPMVMGVCRQLLRDPNDVDDAFQATFLVLVRKAGSLRRSELLGNWLYGVAHRVAMRARVTAARRSARAPFGTDAIDQHGLGDGSASGEMGTSLDSEPIPWLHEEVWRLPEKYRVPVLLCYFEGLTHEQAASRLGWPIGSVKGRLSRARDLLRKRLIRRGVSISGEELVLFVARVAVPESLNVVTLRAARPIAGAAGASVVSLPVANLVEGVLRAMTLTHAKSAGAALLTALGITTGLVLAAGQDSGQPNPPGDPPPVSKAGEKAKAPAPQEKADRKPTPNPESGGMMKSGGMMMRGMMGAMRPNPRAGGMAMGGGAIVDDGTSNDYFSSEKSINGMTLDARMRLAVAELGAAVATWEKSPVNERVRKILDQPLDVSFAKPTPLSEVLKSIRSKMTGSNGPLPIYVDPQALNESGKTLDSEVVIDLEGVPLKTSLRLILKQVNLAYCIRDGVLIISSVEGVREELGEAVRELMGSGHYDEIDFRLLMRAGLLGPRGMGMGGMGNMGMGPGGTGMM